jgi:transposase-like protein
MLAERPVSVSHTTILRWVQRFMPEFEKRWNCDACPSGSSWRVDETYIKVRGRWTYLYHAVDKHGLTVDFRLNEDRDIAAAERFFTRAIEQHGAPDNITLEGDPATHAAIAELKESGVLRPQAKVRTSKYLNHLVEQEHRRVKQRTYPMLGCKKFANAAVTISGIELVDKIRKGQFDTTKLTNRVGGRVPHVWGAVLAA